MMNRRRFLRTVSVSLLAAPLAAEAQQAGKVPKIGALHPGSGTKPLFAALAEVGYVEGRSVVIERRYAEGRLERLPTLAVELVGLKPDIILATGPEAIQAAKNATKTISIIMVFSGDPVEGGVVASLARPASP